MKFKLNKPVTLIDLLKTGVDMNPLLRAVSKQRNFDLRFTDEEITDFLNIRPIYKDFFIDNFGVKEYSDKKVYPIGLNFNVIIDKKTTLFVLAQVENEMYCVISTSSGNRWKDPIRIPYSKISISRELINGMYQDAVSEEDFIRMTSDLNIIGNPAVMLATR